MKCESVAVPFQTLATGEKVLTDYQIAEQPWLMEFINRFPSCFHRSHLGQYWVFKPKDPADPADSAAS